MLRHAGTFPTVSTLRSCVGVPVLASKPTAVTRNFPLTSKTSDRPPV